MFQTSNFKRNHFLELLDGNNHTIASSYKKKNLWIKYFSHSNSLYTRATRAITIYTPIEEYYLRFFPGKTSVVCTDHIQLKYDNISFTIVKDITNIRIYIGLCYTTFWNSIWKPFLFIKELINCAVCSALCSIVFLLFYFIFFFLFSLFQLVLYISSYIIVCHCALYNKLLI